MRLISAEISPNRLLLLMATLLVCFKISPLLANNFDCLDLGAQIKNQDPAVLKLSELAGIDWADRTERKKYLSRVPIPTSLPDEPALYFQIPPNPEQQGIKFVKVADLRLSPSVAESGNLESVYNAARYALLNSLKLNSRREPLKVKPLADDKYEIIDGNATLTTAQRYGWRVVPVLIVDED